MEEREAITLSFFLSGNRVNPLLRGRNCVDIHSMCIISHASHAPRSAVQGYPHRRHRRCAARSSLT
jgi:hypothetical protein